MGKRKFMMQLGQWEKPVRRLAKKRKVKIQEMLRAVMIPDWLEKHRDD